MSSNKPTRYIPPHRRADAGPSAGGARDLADSILPDDSVSCVDANDTALDVRTLSEGDVATALAAIGLGKYSEAVLSVPLRGHDLVHVEDGDLESIGISFRPHRLSLLETFAMWKTSGVPLHLLSNAPIHAAPTKPTTVTDGGSDVSSTPTWLNDAQHIMSQTVQSPSESHSGDSTRPVAPSSSTTDPSSAPAQATSVVTAAAPRLSDMTPSELSMLDVIAARFEGLELRSNAGTAVRAVQAGEQARKAAANPTAWRAPRQ